MMLAGARWYSPHLKQWVSKDPIGYQGGTNMRRYVNNDPIKYADPTGKAPVQNNFPNRIRIKPEGGRSLPPTYCEPGQLCDADGIMLNSPSACAIKIPDNCMATVQPNGVVDVGCDDWHHIPSDLLFYFFPERAPQILKTPPDDGWLP
jgi:hypothetical protein